MSLGMVFAENRSEHRRPSLSSRIATPLPEPLDRERPEFQLRDVVLIVANDQLRLHRLGRAAIPVRADLLQVARRGFLIEAAHHVLTACRAGNQLEGAGRAVPLRQGGGHLGEQLHPDPAGRKFAIVPILREVVGEKRRHEVEDVAFALDPAVKGIGRRHKPAVFDPAEGQDFIFLAKRIRGCPADRIGIQFVVFPEQMRSHHGEADARVMRLRVIFDDRRDHIANTAVVGEGDRRSLSGRFDEFLSFCICYQW